MTLRPALPACLRQVRLDSDWSWRGAVQRVGLRETPAACTSYFKECDFCQKGLRKHSSLRDVFSLERIYNTIVSRLDTTQKHA